MKRHYWNILTRIILILSLGFVSLLHAVEVKTHAIKKESTRFKAQGRVLPLPYKVFWDVLEKEKSGFETVLTTKNISDSSESTTVIPINAGGVKSIVTDFDKIKKYRLGLHECAEKATEATDKLETSDKFALFIDDFQEWIVKVGAERNSDGTFKSVKDSDPNKAGEQIKISEKRFFAYIAAVHEYLEEKKKKFPDKNLANTSSGDTKLLEALSSMAKTMTKIDPVIKDGKIGGIEISKLKTDEITKSVFESVKGAIDALKDAKDACLVKWDAPTDKKDDKKDNKTTPKESPIPGKDADKPKDDSKTPADPAQPGGGRTGAPVVPPGGANGDTGLQGAAALNDAIRQAQEARDRLLSDLDRDNDNVDDLAQLGQLLRGLQPQGNRSADNDRSSQGPTFSPSTQVPNGGGEKQNPFQGPTQDPYQRLPQDNGLAQLAGLLMNQNKGSNADLSGDFYKALAATRTNDVPYTPPAVPLSNPRQDAFLDTMRNWFMSNMMQQQMAGGSRPNIYGRPGVAQAGGPRLPFNGSYSATGGRGNALRVPGARAKAPSPLATAAR